MSTETEQPGSADVSTQRTRRTTWHYLVPETRTGTACPTPAKRLWVRTRAGPDTDNDGIKDGPKVIGYQTNPRRLIPMEMA